METKFTPGPWVIDAADHPSEKNYHFIDAGCGFTGGRKPGFGLSGCMSIDDARLIAAAPDLLKAVEMLLCCMSLAGWDGDMAAETARAALAKAIGEA